MVSKLQSGLDDVMMLTKKSTVLDLVRFVICPSILLSSFVHPKAWRLNYDRRWNALFSTQPILLRSLKQIHLKSCQKPISNPLDRDEAIFVIRFRQLVNQLLK